MAGNDLQFNLGLNAEPFKKGIKDVKNGTEALDKSVKKVGDATKKTGDALVKNFDGAERASRNLDSGLSGVAEQTIAVAQAAKKSGKAFQTALLQTGIGILLVALGEIAANWDKISDAIFGANTALEDQKRLTKEINDELTRRTFINNQALRLQKNSEKTAILEAQLAGKTEAEITAIKRKGFADRIEIQRQAAQEAARILQRTDKADIKAFDDALKAQEKAIGDLSQARQDAGFFELGTQLDTQVKDKAAAAAAQLKIVADRLKEIKGFKPVSTLQSAGASGIGAIGGEGVDQNALDLRIGQNVVAASTLEDFRLNAEALALEAQALQDNINNILTAGAVDGFASIGSAIGDALSNGTNVVQAAGGALLSALGGIIVQLGKQAIGIGVGLIAVKLAFKTLGGIGAIAAGTALVALGTAFGNAGKAASAQMGSGGGGGGASDFSGGGSGVRTSSSTTIGGGNSGGKVVFEIAGDRLIGVLNNATDNGNRILGAESLG